MIEQRMFDSDSVRLVTGMIFEGVVNDGNMDKTSGTETILIEQSFVIRCQV